VLHEIPLSWLTPIRRGAVGFQRGSIVRNVCIAALKVLSRNRELARDLTEITPLDDDLTFEASDSMVVDTIYWFGILGYEGILANVWKMLCRRAKNVLEVGGNIGLYTVLGAREMKGGAYTVVEPLPNVAGILRRNLALNAKKIGPAHIKVLEAAAIGGTAPRKVTISIPREGRVAPVGAHLTDHVELETRSSGQMIAVTGLPFSQLAQGCDLIKIDAEGIEHDLLSSARTLLAETRPIVVIEVLPEAVKLGELIASLAIDCGYIISVIPAYGSDEIVAVEPCHFSSAVPAKYNSKDVILSADHLSLS
jgi:FkbM family methyltransferase